MEQVPLPKTPANVTIAQLGLLPPGSGNNPAGAASWTWVISAYGESQSGSKASFTYVADVLDCVLRKCFLQAQFKEITNNANVRSSELLTSFLVIRAFAPLTCHEPYP